MEDVAAVKEAWQLRQWYLIGGCNGGVTGVGWWSLRFQSGFLFGNIGTFESFRLWFPGLLVPDTMYLCCLWGGLGWVSLSFSFSLSLLRPSFSHIFLWVKLDEGNSRLFTAGTVVGL